MAGRKLRILCLTLRKAGGYDSAIATTGGECKHDIMRKLVGENILYEAVAQGGYNASMWWEKIQYITGKCGRGAFAE